MTTLNTAYQQIDEPGEMEDILIKSICYNCASQHSCSMLANSVTPVIQCEMYECCSSEKNPAGEQQMLAVDSADEYNAVHLLGLCSNCENRLSCSWPKPASGIWHCEGYR